MSKFMPTLGPKPASATRKPGLLGERPMRSGRSTTYRREAVAPRDCTGAWHSAALSTTDETTSIIDDVVELMDKCGYSQKDGFATRLALEEALVNAIKHGNQCDPNRHVEVRYQVTADETVIDITDEGEGFDPNDVPDPCAVENMERSCGRGVFLIRHYMSWVRYNDRGNRVTMGKCKSRD